MSLFDAPVHGAYVLVTSLTGWLEPVLGASATVGAIVVFTMAVRLLLLPLGFAQRRGDRLRSRLLPQLQELQQRHRNNPERLQREIAALQQKEGGSVFAGCLPMFAQLPFFFVMYRLFTSSTVDGIPNGLLTHQLAGAPLGQTWLGAFSAHPVVCLALGVLTALVAWWSARLTAKASASAGGSVATLMRLLPYLSVVFMMFVPLATGIYLLTTTAWTVAQRAVLYRNEPARA